VIAARLVSAAALQAQDLARTQDESAEAPFSFCSFPFLLTARAKSHLLALEARFAMEQVGALKCRD
jgi:hypothetical protein